MDNWWEYLRGVQVDLPAELRAAERRQPVPGVRDREAGQDRRARTPCTSPASVSTRCGPRSSSSTRSRARGSTRAGWAPWASRFRPRWAPRSRVPDAEVWAIDGDGCFQMTNQELATCAVEGAPIKVALINNGNLGMVRQWQTLFYEERYSQTDLATHSHRIPDFVKLAEALGCVGLRCERAEDVEDVINQARAINDRPVVIDFVVGADAQVWPMVAAGTSNDEIMAARGHPPAVRRRRRSTLMATTDPHAVGARRGQARCARPRGGAVLAARLQHRVAGRRRHRAEEHVADDHRGVASRTSRSSRSPSSSTSSST